MAATALSVQVAPPGGQLVAFSTPTQTTGHTAPTGSDVVLKVQNASGGSINCDLHIPAANTVFSGLSVATPAGAAGPSRRVACAIGLTEIPLDPVAYSDPANNGLATFDLSAFASVTLACTRSGS
jgi:hypothetical protein